MALSLTSASSATSFKYLNKLAQIQFLLNRQKQNKEGMFPIVMHVTFNSERVRKSTGQKTLEAHWHEKHQQVKEPRKSEPYNDYDLINSELDKMYSKAKSILKHATFNEIPLSKEYFESEWNSKYAKTLKEKPFVEYFEQFIEVQKPLKAKRTITGYNTSLNFMKDYMEYSGKKITLDNFDMDLFEGLREYAYTIRGLSDNTFSTTFKRYKTLMGWALQKGYHNNTRFKGFKTPEKPREIICLYEDELFELYHYEFKNKRLDKVRDIYCFGCFTGLRFSDIIDLKDEHITGDEIQKVIVKTKEFKRIPLNKFALEILQKYKDLITPLPKISSQKFNDYIKEACKEVGIDTPTLVTRFSGNEVIRKTVPKHELITSHTARKTFTTNSLIFGMNESVVKEITGHKKDENFRRYVKLAESYVKEQANSAWDR